MLDLLKQKAIQLCKYMYVHVSNRTYVHIHSTDHTKVDIHIIRFIVTYEVCMYNSQLPQSWKYAVNTDVSNYRYIGTVCYSYVLW